MKLEYWSDISGGMLAWWFASFVHGPALFYARIFNLPQKETMEEEKRQDTTNTESL